LKKSIAISVSLLILLILLAEFFINENAGAETFSPRSFVIIFVVLFCYFISQSWAQSLSIYGKIKIILALNLLLFAINYFSSLSFDQFAKSSLNIPGLLVFLSDLVFIGLLLSLIHGLVSIQRKKNTRRNFIIFLVFLFSFSLFGQQMTYAYSRKFSPTFPIAMSSRSLYDIFIVLFMIYAMVINSFRLRWIKFLNKSQKIKTFFVSAMIIFLLVLLISKSGHLLGDISAVAHRLFTASITFVIVYFSFSIILILLYLPTAGALDRKTKELASLQQLSRSILGVFDLNKVFDIILQQTIEITGSNYSWLILKESGKRSFRLMAENGMPDKMKDVFCQPTKLNVVKWINDHKNVLMIDRVGKDDRVSDIEKWRHRSGSLLAIPLISNKKILGILFAVKNTEYGFMADDRSLLAMFANNAAIAIENAQLVEKSLTREKYEQELKVAHEAQMKLLPATTPDIPSLEISAVCITANEVGGDYYDFFQYSKNSLGVAIGDVSGKGAEAAFYMAEGKGILESFGQIDRVPAELLCKANEVLYKTLDAKTFISMLFGVFDLKKGIVSFSRAGHCPLLYWKAEDEMVYLVEPLGMALGLISGSVFKTTLSQEDVKYKKGDIFVLFTDGVTEAMNESQEEFGEDRLCELVIEHHQSSAFEIQSAILAEIKSFVGDASQHDDLSLIVIKPK